MQQLSAVLPSGRNLGRITQINPKKIAKTGHLFHRDSIISFQKEAKIIAVRGFPTYFHLILQMKKKVFS
jgi:DNA-binding transcriptional regulator YhcF (GntR family)